MWPSDCCVRQTARLFNKLRDNKAAKKNRPPAARESQISRHLFKRSWGRESSPKVRSLLHEVSTKTRKIDKMEEMNDATSTQVSATQKMRTLNYTSTTQPSL